MRTNTKTRWMLVALLATSFATMGSYWWWWGLNYYARAELRQAGVDQYLGDFDPVATANVGDGWTQHTFDTAGGTGPICIAGTPYSVYTRQGNPRKLLIFMQGGGACWQDFYQCNVLAEDQAPPGPPTGIFDFDNPQNPLRDHSIVYMPYCDGSVFAGDNDVVDPSFPFGPVRFHRGLRNQSAGMDVAYDEFPNARQIVVAGSSAGGVGAAGFAPFLARFQYGNYTKLRVFNDAGPNAINLDDTAAIDARANDWQFGQFFPASCTDCSDMGQGTEIVKWRLKNDRTIREAFYETDGDLTNRFFMNLLFDQPKFRDIVVTEHGKVHAKYPRRYRRFIVAGDTSHTALQSDLFYTQDANGRVLNGWTRAFLRGALGFWRDIVEAPVAP